MSYKKRTLFFKYFCDFFVIMLTFIIIITVLLTYFLLNYVSSSENVYRVRQEEQINQIISNISKDSLDIFSIITAKAPIFALNTPRLYSLPDDEIHNITKPFIDNLSSFMLSNDYLSGAYIYSPNYNWILSNNGFRYFYKNVEDYIWYYDDLESDMEEKTYWTIVSENPRTRNKYISIYKKSETNNLDIILLNLSNIENDISKILSSFKGCTFMVWNLQDNISMFSVGNNTDLSQIYKNHNNNKNNTILKNSFSYSSFDITEYNWRCIFEYDNSETIKGVYSRLLIMIPFSALILLITAFIISYYRAKKSYTPIKNMISVLNNPKNGVHTQNFASDYQYSEIKYIMETILKNIHDKDRIESELENNLELLNEANKYALQVQIKPHFIFNTLEIIYLEAHKLFGDENIVSEMIWSLSDIMRITFKNDNKFITVSTELSYVEKYIYIQSIRYEDLFDTVWDTDESADEYLMPKLILQPIIENAIVHGIIPSGRHCTLTIRSKRKNGEIIFTVEDTGIGMTPERLGEVRKNLEIKNTLPSKNIGISNVNMRIKLMFGDEYGCSIVSSNSNGTITEIKIPEISSQE